MPSGVRTMGRDPTAPLVDEELLAAVGDLASALQEAGDLDEIEARYLESAARLFPFKAVGLYLFGPNSTTPSRIAAHGVSDYFLTLYEEHGRAQDPVLDRVLNERVPVLNRDLMTPDQWRSLPVWDQVFRLHDMTTLLQVPLLSGGRILGTLNFGDHTAPPSQAESTRALAAAVGRLVGLALSSIAVQQHAERRRGTLAAALDICDQAVIVTDLDTGERHLNAAARELCERVTPAVGDSWLEDLLAQAGPRGAEIRSAEESLTVDGTVVRVRARCLADQDDPSVTVSLLQLDDEGEAATLPPDVAAGLTSREREVVRLVVTGLHDHEIAQRLLLSPHTVKDHVKQIYRKLGLDSRVALARRVLIGGRPPADETPSGRGRGAAVPGPATAAAPRGS